MESPPKLLTIKSISSGYDPITPKPEEETDELHHPPTTIDPTASQIALHMKRTQPPEGAWKAFHIFLIISCLVAPLLLIITFIVASYCNNKPIYAYSVSAGIQHNAANKNIYIITLINSIIATILSFFVSICRQIQIAVTFQELIEEFPGDKQSLNRYWTANNVAVWFNITSYMCIVLLVIFDSGRYSSHVYFSSYAFLAAIIFLIMTCIITAKERYMEYRRNLIKYKNDKEKAKQNTFYLDVVLFAFSCVVGIVALMIYMVEFYSMPDVATTKQQTSALGNISEWLSFLCLISGVSVLSVSFHHDSVDDEMIKFWKGIMLWIKEKCYG